MSSWEKRFLTQQQNENNIFSNLSIHPSLKLSLLCVQMTEEKIRGVLG